MNMDAALRIRANVQGENNIRRLGNSMQGLTGRVKNTQMAVRGLTTSMKALGGIIAGAAIVRGFTGMVRQGLEAGDALDKLSARTGAATSSLLGLQRAAQLSDVSSKGLENSLLRLNREMAKSADGNAASARNFSRLNVEVKNADGSLRSADAVMKDIADRFAGLEDGAQKAAIAYDIFGRSGAELIPLLNGGRDAMEAFNVELSDEFAARAAQFNDTMTILGFRSEGFRLQLTDALLPALQGIFDAFSDLFDTKNDWDALFEVIKFGLRVVASAIVATIALLDQMARAVVTAFRAAREAVQGNFAAAREELESGFRGMIEADQANMARFGMIFSDAPAPAAGSRRGRLPAVGETVGGGAAGRSAAARAGREANDISERQLQLQQAILEARTSNNRAAEIAAQLELDLYNAAQLSETPNRQRLAQMQALVKFKEAEKKLNQDIDAASAQRQAQADSFNRTLEDLRIQAGMITGEKLKELQINREIEDILQRFPELTRKQREEVEALVRAGAEAGKTFQESFQERLEDFAKSVEDIGGALGNAVVNAFQGMEDALTDFVTTGKANFADLARSILSDLARIAIRAAIIQPLVGAFGGFFGFADGGIMTGRGPAPLKTYARGGIANSPQLAMFGEGSQPEAFVPLPDGRRIPVKLQGSSSGANVTVNVDARGTNVQGNAGDGEQLARAIASAVQNELIRQKRPGGLLVA